VIVRVAMHHESFPKGGRVVLNFIVEVGGHVNGNGKSCQQPVHLI